METLETHGDIVANDAAVPTNAESILDVVTMLKEQRIELMEKLEEINERIKRYKSK